MKNNKILLPIATAILIVGFLLFSFEKLHVTNFYEKPIITTSGETSRPVNDVDYTPVTSPPDPTINNEKNPGETSNQPTPSAVTASITRANQDISTKNLNVGVLVEGTKTGTCKLELIQNSTVLVTKSADVVEQSGLVTCTGFSVLATDIPVSGTYIVKISVGEATASQSVELKK